MSDEITDVQTRAWLADEGLNKKWKCKYWSRKDQIIAMSEGWSMSVHGKPNVQSTVSNHEEWPIAFDTRDQVLVHIRARAAAGSELHKRALVLVVAQCLA